MPAPRLSLRQLQVFCGIADSGTTAAAAEAIALSQSATSAALLELEHALGLPLFERVGKRLQLNDNGRALLPQARALLDGAGSIERWALDQEAQIGRLRIGASTTIGNYLLPAIVGAFRATLPPAARPALNLQVTIANTEAITRQVAGFELDLGLIEGPCHEGELVVRPWLEDELLVVAAPTDPIVPKSHRSITLEALRRATWLLRESGSGTREMINQLLTPHLQRMRAGVEFGNSEAIKRATASGIGISCLSRYVVADFLRTGELLAPATQLPRLTRPFHLVLHERKQHTRGLDLLLAFLTTWRPLKSEWSDRPRVGRSGRRLRARHHARS
jgi:DNA-binding transcriptional LysR family regulator